MRKQVWVALVVAILFLIAAAMTALGHQHGEALGFLALATLWLVLGLGWRIREDVCQLRRELYDYWDWHVGRELGDAPEDTTARGHLHVIDCQRPPE